MVNTQNDLHMLFHIESGFPRYFDVNRPPAARQLPTKAIADTLGQVICALLLLVKFTTRPDEYIDIVALKKIGSRRYCSQTIPALAAKLCAPLARRFVQIKNRTQDCATCNDPAAILRLVDCK